MDKRTKRCSKCGVTKVLAKFSKDKSKKDEHRPDCKSCGNKINAQYYKNNKDNILEHQRQYYIANKEQISEYQEQYRENNKKTISKRNK